MGYIFITVSVTDCGSPIAPDNGMVPLKHIITEGAEIFFRCNPRFVPVERMKAVCGADGRWNPDPAGLGCTSKCSLYIDS